MFLSLIPGYQSLHLRAMDYDICISIESTLHTVVVAIMGKPLASFLVGKITICSKTLREQLVNRYIGD